MRCLIPFVPANGKTPCQEVLMSCHCHCVQATHKETESAGPEPLVSVAEGAHRYRRLPLAIPQALEVTIIVQKSTIEMTYRIPLNAKSEGCLAEIGWYK